ncbi:hypothetical protein [Nocardioides marmoriginsengisoli]|nr:hypothetical protein [Nocardioides marmoriginsengisoli]
MLPSWLTFAAGIRAFTPAKAVAGTYTIAIGDLDLAVIGNG